MQAYYDGLLERLREARTQNGMTQREASVALGMAHSYMNKCESGERAIDIAELWALAKLYGKPMSFFAPDTL
jgi:transcriptional regulator with XRE-family HTH domain